MPTCPPVCACRPQQGCPGPCGCESRGGPGQDPSLSLAARPEPWLASEALRPRDSSSFLNGAPCSGAASPLGPFPGREGRDGELSPGCCLACPRAWAASGGPAMAGRPLSSPSRVSSAFSDLSCVPSGSLPLVSGHVAQRCSVSRAPADFAGKGSPPADGRWSHWHLPAPHSLRPLVSCVHRLLLPRRVRPGPWGPQRFRGLLLRVPEMPRRALGRAPGRAHALSSAALSWPREARPRGRGQEGCICWVLCAIGRCGRDRAANCKRRRDFGVRARESEAVGGAGHPCRADGRFWSFRDRRGQERQ